VRVFCNIVYAWLMSGCAGDGEAREKLDAHIYAPPQGLDTADANVWAAINRAEDG